MKTDRIFVLLLVVLLPMTGCFDDAVGDAEGTDEADGTSDTGDNGGTQAGDAANSQARTWYSSGGVYQTYWNDGQHGEVTWNDESENISSYGKRCTIWANGQYNDSQSYQWNLNEYCAQFMMPRNYDHWNLTDCYSKNGIILWGYDVAALPDLYYRYAPSCMVSYMSINTSPGEVLLIHEYSNLMMSSTCDGVTVFNDINLDEKLHDIVPGAALSCTHELYNLITYTADEQEYDTQNIWSIVYSIQDTTVV